MNIGGILFNFAFFFDKFLGIFGSLGDGSRARDQVHHFSNYEKNSEY